MKYPAIDVGDDDSAQVCLLRVAPSRYALASPICGAALHASLAASAVNITIVNATSSFFYCRALQNRVQTVSSAAPSLVAPGLAFMFTALEPATVEAATNVTAMWTAGSTFVATCQQTYSNLFRSLTPPIGLKITIQCPQCT
jgi:hypothetical protein